MHTYVAQIGGVDVVTATVLFAGRASTLTGQHTVNWSFVAPPPPPPANDIDNDGVDNNIDTGFRRFSDGTTDGSITSTSGLTITVSDATDPAKGVTLTATGTGTATLSLCGGVYPVILTGPGTYTLTCTSVTLSVTGSPVIMPLSADVSVTVADGGVATIDETEPGVFTGAADAGSTGAVVVTVDGVDTTVAAGDTGTFPEPAVEPEEPVVEPEEPVVEPEPPVVEPAPNAFAEAASGGNFTSWVGGTIAIELALIGFEGQILNVWFWNGSIWLFYGPGLPDAVNSSFILVFGSVLWIVGA